jgi:Holliday junction resolvase RusA-like endonuclease
MSRTISFSVPGKPIAQGSYAARVTKGGKPYLLPADAKALTAWRRKVATAAVAHRVTEIRQAPVRVRLTFLLGDPPKGYASDGWAPVRRGDGDKLARSILDSLVDAKVIVDDAQAVDLHIRKIYGGPGVVIAITDLTGTKPQQRTEEHAA